MAKDFIDTTSNINSFIDFWSIFCVWKKKFLLSTVLLFLRLSTAYKQNGKIGYLPSATDALSWEIVVLLYRVSNTWPSWNLNPCYIENVLTYCWCFHPYLKFDHFTSLSSSLFHCIQGNTVSLMVLCHLFSVCLWVTGLFNQHLHHHRIPYRNILERKQSFFFIND